MRRLLAIALLVLLPAQFAAAAISGYCGHEVGAAAKHLGHHDHEHDAEEAGDQPSQLPQNGSHADCGLCHVGCSAVACPEAVLSVMDVQSELASEALARPYASLSFEPERPNWLRLA